MVDQFDKRSANNSHFTLIRCIVAISLADGEIQPDEKTYIENMLKRLDLTPAQKEILRNDMETRQDPLQLYELIEDPAFKAQVPYFLQLAAWKDNELSTEEQKQILALREKLASESAGFDAEELTKLTNGRLDTLNKPEDMKEEKRSIITRFFDKLTSL